MSFRLAPHLFIREFSSSGPRLVRQKYVKKINRLHRHWAKELFKPKEEYVDPVLGKAQVPFLSRIKALIGQPENQIDKLNPEETSVLIYGAELASKRRMSRGADTEDSPDPGLADKNIAHDCEAVNRIVSLSNGPSSQFRKQAIELARKEFQRFEGDTGSPEVQAAVSTIKIHFLAQHVKATKKDVQSKRILEHAVQTRRNMLLYLKRIDPKRYIWTAEKLGLNDEAISAEFHMSRKYLWQTQFYGDRTLPLKKTKKDTREQRKLEAKKEKAMRYLSQSDPDALL